MIDARSTTSPAPPMMPAVSMPSAPSYYSPPPPPQYGMTPPHDAEKASMYQSHYAPPAPVQAPAPQVTVVQQAPAEPPKKNKFGKLGSTMANSAAGGVGFGAGKPSLFIRPGTRSLM